VFNNSINSLKSGLSATNVRALVVTPENALFAGTHGAGVFRTLDNGATWEAVNDGLANLDIHALAATAEGMLFAGTIGGGLFRRDVATDVANEPAVSLPASYVLEANYPNPFNPSTAIRFGLPEAAAVTVSVYDVAGRRLAVLVQATMAAGWHEAVFDAGALPSGVYFYRLEAGPHTDVRQMVLLR
jgi:Secretion system C-terminal sorting domain